MNKIVFDVLGQDLDVVDSFESTPIGLKPESFSVENTQDAELRKVISAAYKDMEQPDIPKSINELPIWKSKAYELSVSKAGDLNIPVATGISGGHNRRILVLEHTGYKPVKNENVTQNYGLAIRLIITVNKWDAKAKVNLPFIAASAQLGHIEAKWEIQVLGLAGRSIRETMVTPTNLSVETFVLAKQSIENINKSLDDPMTNFIPMVVSVERSSAKIQSEYIVAIAKTAAFSGIKRRWPLEKTIREYDHDSQIINDSIRDIYISFAQVHSDQEKPSKSISNEARLLLTNFDTEIV